MADVQSSKDVLMIRPADFYSNPETAVTNHFQSSIKQPDAQDLAVKEFEALAEALRAAGVRVHIYESRKSPPTPDSLFPNNWVSFHADGTVVLYPMMAPNRRLEKREELLSSLRTDASFRIRRLVDLGHFEDDDAFLEGTGSLVLDRANRIAYACISPRTHVGPLGEFAQRLDYDLVAFDATDNSGRQIYHTNVLMSVGRNFAIVCIDAIAQHQRAAVVDSLNSTGHKVIAISHAQMNNFAGNVLELGTTDDRHILAASTRAAANLTPLQREELQELSGTIVTAHIPTIETLGGGSVRCMLAEIHLPSSESA